MREALAAFGLELEGPLEPQEELPTFHVWPENWPAWELFRSRLRNQWNVGMNGATSLRAEAVAEVIAEQCGRSARRTAAQKRRELREALAAIEAGCLQGFQEAREAAKTKAQQ